MTRVYTLSYTLFNTTPHRLSTVHHGIPLSTFEPLSHVHSSNSHSPLPRPTSDLTPCLPLVAFYITLDPLCTDYLRCVRHTARYPCPCLTKLEQSGHSKPPNHHSGSARSMLGRCYYCNPPERYPSFLPARRDTGRKKETERGMTRKEKYLTCLCNTSYTWGISASGSDNHSVNTPLHLFLSYLLVQNAMFLCL